MRLFIAVELGEEIRRRIARELPALQKLAPQAKWVCAESLHVTLAFLGYLPEDRVPQIQEAIGAASGRNPLPLEAKGLGSFGSSRRPRVLWVGLYGKLEPFARLKQHLERELVPLGYQPEQREFHPHLTLARSKTPGGDAALVRCVEHGRDTEFGCAVVDRLILFRSDLSPKGARYTPLFESRFRKPDQ